MLRAQAVDQAGWSKRRLQNHRKPSERDIPFRKSSSQNIDWNAMAAASRVQHEGRVVGAAALDRSLRRLAPEAAQDHVEEAAVHRLGAPACPTSVAHLQTDPPRWGPTGSSIHSPTSPDPAGTGILSEGRGVPGPHQGTDSEASVLAWLACLAMQARWSSGWRTRPQFKDPTALACAGVHSPRCSLSSTSACKSNAMSGVVVRPQGAGLLVPQGKAAARPHQVDATAGRIGR